MAEAGGRARRYAEDMSKGEFLFSEEDVIPVSEAPRSGQDRVVEAMEDSGGPRSIADHLRIGRPVMDRFGMLWWPVDDRGQLLACAPDREAAGKSRDQLPLRNVRATVGPLRIASPNKEN